MAIYEAPTITTLTCTTHGNNYTFTVPANTKKVLVKPRDGAASEDARMAISTAGMTAGNYILIQSLSTYEINGSDSRTMIDPRTTLVFQFAVDDARVIEIMYWIESNYPVA